MKIIHENISAFGGYMFKAVAERGLVKILESKNGSRYKTIAYCSRGCFDALADKHDLFNDYNNNPAKLYHIAREILA